MSDCECPYCGAGCDINHDDGYGMDENEISRDECRSCGKAFAYTITISVDHWPAKADCLNEGEHVWESTWCSPVDHTKMRCTQCGEERIPTEDEWKVIRSKKL